MVQQFSKWWWSNGNFAGPQCIVYYDDIRFSRNFARYSAQFRWDFNWISLIYLFIFFKVKDTHLQIIICLWQRLCGECEPEINMGHFNPTWNKHGSIEPSGPGLYLWLLLGWLSWLPRKGAVWLGTPVVSWNLWCATSSSCLTELQQVWYMPGLNVVKWCMNKSDENSLPLIWVPRLDPYFVIYPGHAERTMKVTY